MINEVGGEIPPTFGVPVEEIQLGIRHGVRKVNIDTDLRLAITGATRRALAEHRRDFDPRRYWGAAARAAAQICRARYEAFGSAGQAHGIRPIPLEEMARCYAAGQLDSRVRRAAAS